MVTTSLANILMALVYIVVDVKEWWGGEPFFYAGNNLRIKAKLGVKIMPRSFPPFLSRDEFDPALPGPLCRLAVLPVQLRLRGYEHSLG